jgi:hypothetical protein
MKLIMAFKIITAGIWLVALAVGGEARAQAQAGPWLSAAPPSPAPVVISPNLAATPPAPVAISPNPAAAPPSGSAGAPPGPAVELPPEQDMPQMSLPRESAIENPLRHESAPSATALGGYGELTLNAPGNGPAIIDLRRLVVFIGHNFTDRIRFYSELEVEHAVASSDDRGEFEVEQAYLDDLGSGHLNLRAGLIIMPVGIINVYHEPPTFNGVDRPDVDTLVIPSTWREPGFGVFGEIREGLAYQLYLVNGFDSHGFTAASGIADGHQEAQLAHARDFGGVARLTYEPRLATIFGASAYASTSGDTWHETVGNVPLLLLEADGRTRHRGFEARGEVAILFIGDAGALDAALAAVAATAGDPAPAPVASQLRGAYLDVGYDLLRVLAPGAEATLTLFGRFDYANTQASVPAGFVADASLIRYTYTLGLLYRPIQQIGIKLDYRRHELGGASGDGNLGIDAGFNEVAAALTWMF